MKLQFQWVVFFIKSKPWGWLSPPPSPPLSPSLCRAIQIQHCKLQTPTGTSLESYRNACPFLFRISYKDRLLHCLSDVDAFFLVEISLPRHRRWWIEKSVYSGRVADHIQVTFSCTTDPRHVSAKQAISHKISIGC
jgi:hypothetical protein